MTSLEIYNIEQLTRVYRQAYIDLSLLIDEIDSEISSIKKQYDRMLKARASKVASRHQALKQAISDNPHLFVKPRTTVFYDTKVGFKIGKGKTVVKDEDKAMDKIRRHLPEQVNTLIETKEKIITASLSKLPADLLKKIGAEIIDTGDQVVISAINSDTQKKVNALLAEFNIEYIR